MKVLSTFKKITDQVLVGSLMFLLFVMLFCVGWQVFSRYVLNAPATFTEELVRFLLVWVGLLGATYSFGTHKHLSLNLLFDSLAPKIQLVIRYLIITIIALVALGVLVYGGFQLMKIAGSQVSSVMSIPMKWVYSILPLSGILIFFYQVYDFVALINQQEVQ